MTITSSSKFLYILRGSGLLCGVQPNAHNTRIVFCIYPMNFAMATLGLMEMGKFLWEGWEKNLPS